jgi:hypothetical protein
MGKNYLLCVGVAIILAHSNKIQGRDRRSSLASTNQCIVFKDELGKAGARVRKHNYTIISSQEHNNNAIDWSILICTLPQRQETFNRLYTVLMQQIKELCLQDRIEIVCCEDNGQSSIGFKRNMLLKASRGEYVNFLDDDDMVHENYIYMIYSKLRYKPDCISLTGIQTTLGTNSILFIQSLAYDTCYEENGIRYLPPHHTNTIKRSIAIQFAFPHINIGEDRLWALKLRQSGLLQYEIVIEEPYYFYHYNPRKTNDRLKKGRRNNE